MTTTIELKQNKQERAAGKSPALAGIGPGVTVKFGLDVHAAQITVCRQVEGLLPQPAQKLGWPECVEWIAAHRQAGATVQQGEASSPSRAPHLRLTRRAAGA